MGWLVVFAVFDQLSAGRSGGNPLVTAAAAACATLGVLLVAHRARAAFGFRIRWLRRLVHLPGMVLLDVPALIRALKQPGSQRWGRSAARTFDAGGADAVSHGRRALVVAAVSLPPNTFVTAVELDKGELRIHELVPPNRRGRLGGAQIVDPAWPLTDFADQ